MPTVTVSETRVKALRKRCVLRLDLKDVRDGDNRVCIGTEFHTQSEGASVHISARKLYGLELLLRAQELCESRGGRPGPPSLISLRFL